MAKNLRMVKMAHEAIVSPKVSAPGGHYSQAIAARDMVFVSGQLPIYNDEASLIGAPFESQVHQVMSNVMQIIARAGLTKNDIVKVTAFIVGVHRWPEFNTTYAEIMGVCRPARSVVPVPELHHGYLIEMEAIAVRSTCSASHGQENT